MTILTGFLGSGKTTLLNWILEDPNHGLRFAIIENEFGDVGVDERILSEKADEEVIEVMNGCICCTVRGDLVVALKKLYSKVSLFDAIIIETTGLADPAPVAQTFFVDEEVQALYSLDGIITVADAKHILTRLDDEKPEGVENEARLVESCLVVEVPQLSSPASSEAADPPGAGPLTRVLDAVSACQSSSFRAFVSSPRRQSSRSPSLIGSYSTRSARCTRTACLHAHLHAHVHARIPLHLPLNLRLCLLLRLQVDLVAEAELGPIEERLKKINPTAAILRCEQSKVRLGGEAIVEAWGHGCVCEAR